ncbi:MAG: hypothetical protein AB1762_13750 [Gemmatimonadota bacterium]
MPTFELDRLHLGAISDPTNTTDPAIWVPSSAYLTNDRWPSGIWVFGALAPTTQPTVRITIFLPWFRVPDNYSAASTDPSIVIYHSSTITSGNRVWDVDYRAVGGDDAESLDQTGQTEPLSITDAAPTAAHNLLETSVAMARAGIAAGDIIQASVSLDGVDAADTIQGLSYIANVAFRYTGT